MKKLPKLKWVLLCCGVILIAACAVGAALWFTQPSTLEAMTAHMPENPSEAWMQRYVDLAQEPLEETVRREFTEPEPWLAWYEEQPLVDEVGGGQFFIAKWLVGIPQSHASSREQTDSYQSYYVRKAAEDPVVQAVVDLKAPDSQQWWEWFHNLPTASTTSITQYSAAQWVVGIPTQFSYPYEETAQYSYNLFLLAD